MYIDRNVSDVSFMQNPIMTYCNAPNSTSNEALHTDFPEVLSYYKFSLCKYEMPWSCKNSRLCAFNFASTLLLLISTFSYIIQ